MVRSLRFGRLAKTPDKQAPRLSVNLDAVAVDPGEVDANGHSLGAPIGVDRRLPDLWRTELGKPDFAQLVNDLSEPSVQSSKMNALDIVHAPPRKQTLATAKLALRLETAKRQGPIASKHRASERR